MKNFKNLIFVEFLFSNFDFLSRNTVVTDSWLDPPLDHFPFYSNLHNAGLLS
jgi:hypothetical protein